MEQGSYKEVNPEKKSGGKHRYNNYKKKKRNHSAEKAGVSEKTVNPALSCEETGVKNDRSAKNNRSGKK